MSLLSHASSQSGSDEDCAVCNSNVKYLYAAVLNVPEAPLPPEDDESAGILNDKFIRIINLGPVVNTEGVDYAPTISADGRTLYFVSDREGGKLNDKGNPSHEFWKTTHENRLDTIFTAPVNLDTSTIYGDKGVNTSLNEGAASIAADRQSLYFTGCGRADGLGSCDIYFSEIEGDKWGQPINLGKNVNSKFWDSQPSIMYNKSRIYFASDRPNKFDEDGENIDIWYCDWDWDNEDWLPAKNLEAVNTDGKDWSPFIGTDGVSLFFASDGHEPSYGGMDFYRIILDPDNNTWGKVQNLGTPLNTKGDESFITMPASGDVIYFSSTRTDLKGYQGKLDLFMAFVPTFYRTSLLKVYVQDECSGENIPADIIVTNRITNGQTKGSVTIENKEFEMVIANADFGRDRDSNETVQMLVSASNPKYGKGEKIISIKRPAKTKNQAMINEPDHFDTVVVTLGQKPSIGTIIEEANYVSRMKSEQPELASFNGLVMEQIQTWDLYPLLNYVFFDLGSSELPNRYIKFDSPEAAKAFTDTTIVGGTLDKYYHILNIYGYRLKQHPESKIEIVGCNDDKTPAEKRPNLSKERAQLVYDYFKKIWGIEESRMKLTIRKSPQTPSNKDDSLGIQENRRVELICSDWEIYMPVFDKDPKTFPQPEEMIFTLKNGIEDQLVVKRRVEIKRNGQMWKVLNDIGLTEPRYTWDWLNEDEKYPKDEAEYVVQLIVSTSSGHECKSDPITIPVMQVSTEKKAVVIKTGEGGGASKDSTLENYSLILFPFNSAQPGPKNDKIMNDYVYDRCKPSSHIQIIGHTDVVGLNEHNQTLSQNRAASVDAGIKKKTGGKYGYLNVRGVGEDEPLYDNSLPEGRFYNRTVNVIIRTPVEEYENK